MNQSKLLLEATTCGRCGGTGSYSWNAMHGSVCYGCRGRGEVLTKRGLAAQAWLNEQRMLPASEFKVGDSYFSQGFSAGSFSQPNRWIKIESIEVREDGQLVLNGVDVKRASYDKFAGESYTCAPDTKLRKAQSAEQKKALHAAALAYQATLGKSGKPLKRLAAAA